MNQFYRRLLGLPVEASTFAPRVDHLHFFVITVTMFAALGVALTALGLYVRFRRRSVDQPIPQEASQPGVLYETITIGVPLILFLSWFAWGYRDFVWMSTPPPDSMNVYVTAKKWMWKFTYPGGPASIEVLHVPVGRPIRLLLTSRDVIHSFFVPAFRMKQDAVPGRYTQTWFQATRTGHYQVLCAEYCGLNHSSMWGEVVVMPQADFDAWMARERMASSKDMQYRQDGGGTESALPRPPEFVPPQGGVAEVRPETSEQAPPEAGNLAEEGRRVAVSAACVKCHTIDGTPHIGPTWQGLYDSEVTLSDGSRVKADEAYLTESMMDPMAKIVNGFPPVMPTYQGRLSPPEIAALLEFIKSLAAAGPTAHRPNTRAAFQLAPPPQAAAPPEPAPPPPRHRLRRRRRRGPRHGATDGNR